MFSIVYLTQYAVFSETCFFKSSAWYSSQNRFVLQTLQEKQQGQCLASLEIIHKNIHMSDFGGGVLFHSGRYNRLNSKIQLHQIVIYIKDTIYKTIKYIQNMAFICKSE